MSEIRVSKIKIADLGGITNACLECGYQLQETLLGFIIKGHGIRTWGGTDIELQKQADGNYALVGDASKAELDKLGAKLKTQYNIHMIQKAGQKLGFTVKTARENGKVKIKLRTFN